MSSKIIPAGVSDNQVLKSVFESVRDKFGWAGVEYNEAMHKAVVTGLTDQDINGTGAEPFVTTVVDGTQYGVAPTLMDRMGHWVAKQIMGDYPKLEKTSIVHFDEQMCGILFDGQEVPNVLREHELTACDIRSVRHGGHCAKVLSGLFVRRGSTYRTCADGHNFAFNSVRGVPLSGNVVLTFPIDHVVKWEFIVGSARVVEPVGDFTHFGVSVPAMYVPKLVFRSRNAGFFTVFVQTDVPDKRLGKLEEHKNVDAGAPRVSFTGAVSSAVNGPRVPNAAGLYSVAAAGPAQSLVQFMGIQFLSVAHLSVMTSHSVTFDVLLPGGYAGLRRYVAVVPAAAVSHGEQQTYDYMLESRLCTAWDGMHTSNMVAGTEYPDVAEVMRTFAGNIRVHTIERDVYTSFTGHFAGTYTNVPGTNRQVFQTAARASLPVAFL